MAINCVESRRGLTSLREIERLQATFPPFCVDYTSCSLSISLSLSRSPSRAGGGDGVVGPPQAVLDGDVPRRQIDQDPGLLGLRVGARHTYLREGMASERKLAPHAGLLYAHGKQRGRGRSENARDETRPRSRAGAGTYIRGGGGQQRCEETSCTS